MSVLMTLRVSGNAKAVEAIDPAFLKNIADRAREHGLLRHRFYGTEDEVLVVDEWPDEDSFRRFFEASPEIKDLMAQAGVTTEPTIEFWRELDTDDAVG